ncbi:hypothetical protein ABTM11_20120, partial [Acinetobacter baumannii]
PLARRVAVAKVAWDGLSVRVRPAQTGSEVAAAPASTPSPATAAPAAPAAAPWQWSVAQFHLGARNLDVQTQADAPWPRLTQLLLDVQGLDAGAKA